MPVAGMPAASMPCSSAGVEPGRPIVSILLVGFANLHFRYFTTSSAPFILKWSIRRFGKISRRSRTSRLLAWALQSSHGRSAVDSSTSLVRSWIESYT